MTELAKSLTDLAKPLAASLGLDLWGIELLSGHRMVVRVYAESEKGISIDECASLSRLLGLTLEVEDLLPGAFVLEVSSPGLERIFFTEEQLAGALGEVVEVSLFSPVEAFPGRRKFCGTLTAVADGTVCIALDESDRTPEQPHDVSLPYQQIKKAKKVFIPPVKNLPGKTAKPSKKGQDEAQDTSPAGKKGLKKKPVASPVKKSGTPKKTEKHAGDEDEV